MFKQLSIYYYFSESIFGYRTLKITIYYLHNSFQTFVDIKRNGELKNKLYKVDDVETLLDPWLPPKYTKNKDEFVKLLKSEKHDTIFGDVLYEEDVKSNGIFQIC